MEALSRTFKLLFGALILLNISLLGFITYMLINDNPDLKEVERIDIVEKNGTNRIVISNEEHIPLPIIKGKSYERRVSPAGLIFYDQYGDERGGIAISETENENMNAIVFDYQNADAIGIFAKDDKQNKNFEAGLGINDKDLSGKAGYNTNRINLGTRNGNAALVIRDTNEIPRLVLKVDSIGTPSIEIFDENGEVEWKR